MRYLLICLTLLSGLVGCGDNTPAEQNGLHIATSLPPHGWLIQQIAGEEAEVVVTLPPGSSPATYQPSDQQVSTLMKCAVYFRAGVPFEHGGWFQAIRVGSDLEILDLRKGISLRSIEAHHHEGEEAHEEHEDEAHHHEDEGHDEHAHDDEQDPHTWLSPENLIVQATLIRDTLIRLDPERASAYNTRYDTLVEKLHALDAELKTELEPLRGSTFFVFHPSWGYFADRYGLHQVAIEIAGKDPSDRELTELQKQARDLGIRCVFVQPQITGRSAMAVAEAIQGEVAILDPLEPDIIRNLNTVAKQLIATAPSD